MADSNIGRQVEALRSFNRFYTHHIGVLEERLLQSPFSLTQARVLFELGTRKAATAGQISEALGLDLGYLSRIVQEFDSRGLIARKRSSDDGRRVDLSLTAKGRKAFQEIDRRSREEIAADIDRLPNSDRERLLVATSEVRRILSRPPDAPAPTIKIRTHRSGDVGWAIERHGTIYADEYQWNEEFEALVATIFARFLSKHDPASERMWIAELEGERVGCVFVVRNADDPEAAQLRCLLVDPKGRGFGVGRKLVAECIAFAKSAGYQKMVLWTNDVLHSARRIYEAEGFQLTREDRHHSFGHDLVGQIWTLDF
jgi:DNA-binding MarR family transcriptional regulator/GNAT superfamily N-acetyltransferase